LSDFLLFTVAHIRNSKALARYFGTSERFWLNLQTEYALRQAQINKADQIAREIEPHAA